MSSRVPSPRPALGAAAAVGLALGVVVVFAPGLVPAGVHEAAASVQEGVSPWVVTLCLSVLALASALVRFRRADAAAVDPLVDPSEFGSVDGPGATAQAGDGTTDSVDADRPGRQFDWTHSRALARLEVDPDAEGWEAERVRERLREAVRAVRGADRTRAAVEAELADGSWTEDRVAAAFLGGETAPERGLARRLYAWLYPARAFERRAKRTVDAIEVAAGGAGEEPGPVAGDAESREERTADERTRRADP